MDVTSDTATALSLWEPRRQMTLSQARRRSRRVSILRLLFTAGAAISAGVMIGHLAANAVTSSGGAIEKLSSDEVVTMVNPRFTGRDVAGQAFVITADTAQRRRDDSEQIDLANPELVNEDGTIVRAPAGLYDQKAQTLSLFEDVQVTDSRGYNFRSTSAKMFIEESRIQGIDPLAGTGPLGEVRCDNYEIVEDGEKMRCNGNVQMTIFPGGKDKPAPQPQDDRASEELDANE